MPTSIASKKLLGGIVVLIVLSLCLCLTTFALVFSMIPLENNIFQTGFVKIDLNGGNPVIEDRELIFAPGLTVEKDFFIKNESTCNVYYRLYFENVEGSLASVLDVAILDGETPLYTGKADKLTKENPTFVKELAINEQHKLTVTFSFPVGKEDDSLQNQSLGFDLRADAVQTKNNPKKLFQ